MPRPKDLRGKRFGRLVPIEPRRVRGRYGWLCKCDCGNETEATTSDLTCGNTSSCGCYRTDMNRDRFATHGSSHNSRLYDIWVNMRQRCSNENADKSGRYVKRGISVCESWETSFEEFRDWAYENGYSDTLTIDRIDYDGNYEPSNCRWATYEQQARNKSSNRIETYKGVTASLVELCEIFDKNYHLVNCRIQQGWSFIDAMELPCGSETKRHHHYLTFRGETKTLAQFAKELGFKRSIIGERLKRGWTVEEALTIKAGEKR